MVSSAQSKKNKTYLLFFFLQFNIIIKIKLVFAWKIFNFPFKYLIINLTGCFASSRCEIICFNASNYFLISVFILFISLGLKVGLRCSRFLSPRTYSFSDSIVFSGYQMFFSIVLIYIRFYHSTFFKSTQV